MYARLGRGSRPPRACQRCGLGYVIHAAGQDVRGGAARGGAAAGRHGRLRERAQPRPQRARLRAWPPPHHHHAAAGRLKTLRRFRRRARACRPCAGRDGAPRRAGASARLRWHEAARGGGRGCYCGGQRGLPRGAAADARACRGLARRVRARSGGLGALCERTRGCIACGADAPASASCCTSSRQAADACTDSVRISAQTCR